MNRIKILLVIVIIAILSGCSANANITMDENGKIVEEVDVLTSSSLISNRKDRIDSYLNTALKAYMPVLQRRHYSSHKINNPKGNSGIKLTNNHDNICKYIENTVFSQFVYEKISCIDDGKYYEIKNVTDHIKYCDYCIDRPAIENINLKITLPIKAEESDADLVNGNTYVWQYDEDTLDDKTFYLKIDKAKLKKNEVKVKSDKKTRTFIFKMGICILLISVVMVFSFKMYKMYKKNNEY